MNFNHTKDKTIISGYSKKDYINKLKFLISHLCLDTANFQYCYYTPTTKEYNFALEMSREDYNKAKEYLNFKKDIKTINIFTLIKIRLSIIFNKVKDNYLDKWTKG